jgi:ribosomal protein S18 acetylase RimI-like enzyme
MTIDIRQVDTFDEAALKGIAEPIFGDAARQQHLKELIGPEAAERHAALRQSLPKADRIRIGAFDGDRLIGYSQGWFEPGGGFYIGSSAVDADYRRQGLYTQLLKAIEQTVRERGGISISSQHVATNNAVLIAKLKLGYVIAGTEYVDAMGLLVRLLLNLTAQRAALFAARTGMLVP